MTIGLRQAGLASAFGLVVVAAFAVGRATAPEHDADAGSEARSPQAVAALPDPRLLRAKTPSKSDRSAESVRLDALGEAAPPADPREDPVSAVGSLIDRMDRHDLAVALRSLTGQPPESLEEVSDLHRYAKSLAAIAMAGLLTDAPERAVSEIEFAARIADTWEEGPAQTVFSSDQARMFGVFPLEGSTPVRLVAKWYRVDTAELLMFEEVPVLPQDGQAFVRFDRRDGWPEGDYRLELYAPGEQFELVAAGQYETRGYERPRRVTLQ